MKHRESDPLYHLVWVMALTAGLPSSIQAGPNLMAIGDYGAAAYQRADGRDSFSGKEILYSFTDLEFDFGRIVIRSSNPNSVVRRDLFVGFSGEALLVDARGSGGGKSVQIEDIEIWLRIQGKIRPQRSYEWECEVVAGNNILDRGFPAVIPALWIDGDPFSVEVTVQSPPPPDTDRIQRMLLPRGVVKFPNFLRQTGAAWVVLKPKNISGMFAVRRFSFREIDDPSELVTKSDLPIPIRYVPIRSVVEDGIAEALIRGVNALWKLQDEKGIWSGEDLEQSVRNTSLVLAALAERNPDAKALPAPMDWLRRQEQQSDKPWGVLTVAARLYCLSRHGTFKVFRNVIHRDIRALAEAQLDDGGWSTEVPSGQSAEHGGIDSSNVDTALVLSALREAGLAGAEVETRVWRRAMRYLTEAQVYDGGFRRTRARFGGAGQATISAYTALGAGGLISCLDMSSGLGGRDCKTYLASKGQLRAITEAIDWLGVNYRERFKDQASFSAMIDPYLEPAALTLLGTVSGISHFNGRNHFLESARDLLRHYDSTQSMSGVRDRGDEWIEQPNLERTAAALSILGSGAAPTPIQRIVVGDDEHGWGQYRGDAAHLVRYLSKKRRRPLNWRRTTIDRDVAELVEVPILILSVVGPVNWTKDQWQKIREYCFAGGTVVVDIADGQEALRGEVETGLGQAFPEYKLASLPSDDALFTDPVSLKSPPKLQALGNGFRHFLFVPQKSWSCRWHLYQVERYEESFALMNNLLTYTTDGARLRTSFAPSTYAVGAIPTHTMSAAHLEVGGDIVAYPNLIDTMDRLMSAHFRLEVSKQSPVEEVDLLWVSVTGDGTCSQAVRSRILQAARSGKHLLFDVVSGNREWDENFEAQLRSLDGFALEPLRRTDPVFTGEIAGTRGSDAVSVGLRQALQTRFATRGRAALHAVYYKGKRVGVYSAYDLASGIGYNYFPDCRGVIPEHARSLVMNAFLLAYEHRVRGNTSP